MQAKLKCPTCGQHEHYSRRGDELAFVCMNDICDNHLVSVPLYLAFEQPADEWSDWPANLPPKEGWYLITLSLPDDMVYGMETAYWSQEDGWYGDSIIRIKGHNVKFSALYWCAAPPLPNMSNEPPQTAYTLGEWQTIADKMHGKPDDGK